jgi:hypothetical protein
MERLSLDRCSAALVCRSVRHGVAALQGSERQAQQVLNQVAALRGREAQAHARVVVLDDVVEGPEPAIMVEPALEVREDGPDR